MFSMTFKAYSNVAGNLENHFQCEDNHNDAALLTLRCISGVKNDPGGC